MRALILALALAACGQAAEAPAGDEAGVDAAPFDLPMQYQPFTNATGTAAWFVCDTVGGSRIFVGSTPDESGAFELREYEKGQATPARTLALTLYNDPALNNPSQFSFRGEDGVVSFNGAFADAYAIPIDLVGIGLEGAETCRLMSRTYLTAFTANRSFVVRDASENELEYLGYDASNWEDAGFEQAPDGSRTNSASVRAAGSRVQSTDGTVQYEFPAGSAYLYRVTLPYADAEPTLEVLRNGEVITREPIIAMQLGARR
jgi:hypothetical protein